MAFSIRGKVQQLRAEIKANRDYSSHMKTGYAHLGDACRLVIRDPTTARKETDSAYTEFKSAADIAKTLVDTHGPFRKNYGTKGYNAAKLAFDLQPAVRPLAAVARKSI